MQFRLRNPLRLLGTALLLGSGIPTVVYAQPAITLDYLGTLESLASVGGVTGVTNDLITEIQVAPGDFDRLFVCTRQGRIHILQNATGTPYLSGVFMDINQRVFTPAFSGDESTFICAAVVCYYKFLTCSSLMMPMVSTVCAPLNFRRAFRPGI